MHSFLDQLSAFVFVYTTAFAFALISAPLLWHVFFAREELFVSPLLNAKSTLLSRLQRLTIRYNRSLHHPSSILPSVIILYYRDRLIDAHFFLVFFFVSRSPVLVFCLRLYLFQIIVRLGVSITAHHTFRIPVISNEKNDCPWFTSKFPGNESTKRRIVSEARNVNQELRSTSRILLLQRKRLNVR